MTRSGWGASTVPAIEKDQAESSLLAAIRDLRDEIERQVDDQKALLFSLAADWEAEPPSRRAAAPPPPAPSPQGHSPGPSRPEGPSGASPTAKRSAAAPRPSPSTGEGSGGGPTEATGGDDIGRRLKDLNSRLERLKTTSPETGDTPSRPGR